MTLSLTSEYWLPLPGMVVGRGEVMGARGACACVASASGCGCVVLGVPGLKSFKTLVPRDTVIGWL